MKPTLPLIGRWTPGRKAKVIQALAAGTYTLEEVCQAYDLTIEEIDNWRRLYEAHGERGLRARTPSLTSKRNAGSVRATSESSSG